MSKPELEGILSSMADTKVILDPTDSDYQKKLKTIFDTATVRNDRVYLRGLTEADITDEYTRFYQDENHIKYMFQSKRKITSETLKKQISHNNQAGDYHIYGVFDNSSHICIGSITIGAINHSHKISDLSIFIGHKNYIGKGYAQDAIRLGNELCFSKYDFRKLHSGMFAENMASVKAYLKTGWVIEGILKGQYWVQQKAMDRYCVACFNPKYFSEEFIQSSKQISDQYLAKIQRLQAGGQYNL